MAAARVSGSAPFRRGRQAGHLDSKDGGPPPMPSQRRRQAQPRAHRSRSAGPAVPEPSALSPPSSPQDRGQQGRVPSARTGPLSFDTTRRRDLTTMVSSGRRHSIAAVSPEEMDGGQWRHAAAGLNGNSPGHDRSSNFPPPLVRAAIGWLLPRILSVAIVASALAVRLALPVTTFAAGTADCSEGPLTVNHWRGEFVAGGAKHGTSGTVPGRTLQMCTNPNPVLEFDGSFYFSNVEPTNGSFRDIVQIGFGQGRSPSLVGGMHFVSGWGRSTSTPGCAGFSNQDPLAVQRGVYDNKQHDYKVYHQNDMWRLLVDSVQKAGVPEGSICWSPGRSSWFGETWDRGDQMGGTAGSHLPVTLMNYANAENGGFYWTSLTVGQSCNYDNNPPAAYRCSITTSKSIDIWTADR